MKTLQLVPLTFLLIFILSCSHSDQRQSKVQLADTLISYKTYAAPEWTNLFYRNEGWFGADGVFAVTLSGDESIGAGKEEKTRAFGSKFSPTQFVPHV